MQTRKRRSFGKEVTDSDWEKVVLTALKGTGTFNWGCLSKKYELFRISTLTKIRIPAKVVHNLEDTGKIYLDDSEGYYKYIQGRKRVLFS